VSRAFSCVHHIDGDPTNNDVSNLRIMSLRVEGPAILVTHDDVREAHKALGRGGEDKMTEWALEQGRIFGQALVDRLIPEAK
jgi:hypothetical protein